MKSKILGLIAVGLLAAPPAFATVTYQFDFTDLITHPDFTLSLTYDNYVTTTGLMPLASPLPTSLGFSVIRAGTDLEGNWGFDGGNTATLNDAGAFLFDSNSFVFDSSTSVTDYITSPGTYPGLVFGNVADGGFRGVATLVVASAPSVPEPSTSALTIIAGLGLLGLVAGRRKIA